MDNAKETKYAKEINLKALFRVIKKRLWIIIVLSFLTALAGGLYSIYQKTPLYQASARVIIGADTDFMKTLQVMVKEPVVMEGVIKELGIEKSPESLGSEINTTSIGGSQVVIITVTDTDPQLAADIANATVKVFKSEAVKIFSFNKFIPLTDAKVNNYPVNLDTTGTVMKAFALGLILGIGLVFLLDSLDETVKTKREVEEMLGLIVLGSVSKINRKSAKRKRNAKLEFDLRGETIGFK